LSEVPEGQKLEKTLFEIRNKLAQQLYEGETAEVKREVEEHRKKSLRADNNLDADTPDLAKRNRSFQGYDLQLFKCSNLPPSLAKRSINKLSHILQLAADSIMEQTGWDIVVMVGGSNPCLGGKITTLV